MITLSSFKLAKEATPHFGINEKSAEEIIKSFEKIFYDELINDELINIVQRYGGNNQLIERVMKCLERQHDMIYKQWLAYLSYTTPLVEM